MVVFACNACGASVKKNQVEKHYQQQCRRCESLSCMDCGKDFWGEDYKHHNKCITEDEKYAAKGWQPKSSANKGERKQEAWIESINSAVENATDMTPALRQLLSTLTQHSNIPRKKKKFENFISNSVHVRNQALVEQAWKVFEAAVAKPKEEGETPANERKHKAMNGARETEAEVPEGAPKKNKTKPKQEPLMEDSDAKAEPVAKKKSKREKKMERSKKKTQKMLQNGDSVNGSVKGKRKLQEDEPEGDDNIPDEEPRVSKKKQKLDGETAVERLNATLDESALASAHASKKFDWTGVVLALLGNRSDHELTLKKLRKKVVGEYECRGCEGKPNTTKEEIWAKLDKKLKKMPQVKVVKDNVKLVSV